MKTSTETPPHSRLVFQASAPPPSVGAGFRRVSRETLATLDQDSLAVIFQRAVGIAPGRGKEPLRPRMVYVLSFKRLKVGN